MNKHVIVSVGKNIESICESYSIETSRIHINIPTLDDLNSTYSSNICLFIVEIELITPLLIQHIGEHDFIIFPGIIIAQNKKSLKNILKSHLENISNKRIFNTNQSAYFGFDENVMKYDYIENTINQITEIPFYDIDNGLIYIKNHADGYDIKLYSNKVICPLKFLKLPKKKEQMSLNCIEKSICHRQNIKIENINSNENIISLKNIYAKCIILEVCFGLRFNRLIHNIYLSFAYQLQNQNIGCLLTKCTLTTASNTDIDIIYFLLNSNIVGEAISKYNRGKAIDNFFFLIGDPYLRIK
jgi:hypothetical protein